jgi:hypothetical protein
MTLNKEQCNLLLDIINGSIAMAKYSGIPIDDNSSKNIDDIKQKLYEEIAYICRKEEVNATYK